MALQVNCDEIPTLVALLAGTGLVAHPGGAVGAKQVILATHPVLFTDTSEVKRKVSAPLAFIPVITPGLVVPLNGLPLTCGADVFGRFVDIELVVITFDIESSKAGANHAAGCSRIESKSEIFIIPIAGIWPPES